MRAVRSCTAMASCGALASRCTLRLQPRQPRPWRRRQRLSTRQRLRPQLQRTGRLWQQGCGAQAGSGGSEEGRAVSLPSHKPSQWSFATPPPAPSPPPPSAGRVLLLSNVVYGALAASSLGAAHLMGVPLPWGCATPQQAAQSVAQGVVWAVPMVALMLVLTSERAQRVLPPLKHTTDFCVAAMLPSLRPFSAAGLAYLSAITGVGEEMLFRGLVQGALAGALAQLAWCPHPHAVAVALVALAFGALHAVTPIYGVMATAAGAYLGVQYIWCGGLLAPCITHALYDCTAFFKLRWDAERRWKR